MKLRLPQAKDIFAEVFTNHYHLVIHDNNLTILRKSSRKSWKNNYSWDQQGPIPVPFQHIQYPQINLIHFLQIEYSYEIISPNNECIVLIF